MFTLLNSYTFAAVAGAAVLFYLCRSVLKLCLPIKGDVVYIYNKVVTNSNLLQINFKPNQTFQIMIQNQSLQIKLKFFPVLSPEKYASAA